MALKDFDAARRERRRNREPIAFRLGGQEFTLPATLPAGHILDLIEADADGNPVATLVACRRFLAAILASDEDRERLEVVLRSHDDPVDLNDDLIEVVDWIAEQYTGRPTKRSSDSSDGPQTNGNGSSSSSSEVAAVHQPTSPPAS